jgi:nucleoside phosphorylase
MVDQDRHILRFRERAGESSERRQDILRAVLETIDSSNISDFLPVLRQSTCLEFILHEDIRHLLDICLAEIDSFRLLFLHTLIELLVMRDGGSDEIHHENLEEVYRLWKESKDGAGIKLDAFEAYFNHWFKEVSRESNEAQAAAASYKLQKKEYAATEARHAEAREKDAQFSTPRLVAITLNDLTQGKICLSEAWWRLCQDLYTGPEGNGFIKEEEMDLSESLGWATLDAPTHEKIFDIATAYILDPDENIIIYLDNYLNLASRSGYKALHLLMLNRPNIIEELPKDIWGFWAKSVAGFDSFGKHKPPRILELALKHGEEEFASAVLCRLDLEISSKFIRCLDEIKSICETAYNLNAKILERIQDDNSSDDAVRSILSFLLQIKDENAILWAESLISKPVPIESKTLSKISLVAEILIYNQMDPGWESLLSLCQEYPDISRELWSSLAPYIDHYHGNRDVLKGINEEQLSKLYSNLASEFPPNTDPVESSNHGMAYSVTNRMHISRMRGAIIHTIALRNSVVAREELSKLAEANPESDEVRNAIELWDEENLRKSWQPIDVSEVLIMGKEQLVNPEFAVVTALPIEHAAVYALLENPISDRPKDAASLRVYDIGSIPVRSQQGTNGAKHLVVLSQVVEMGNTTTAASVTNLLRDYPSVRYIIMCGIGGGVPSIESVENHVRLGDIVISGSSGVIEFDRGKANPDGFEFTHPPRPPSQALSNILKGIQSARLRGERPWLEYIPMACKANQATIPLPATDILLATDSNEEISHPVDPSRKEGEPQIIIGSIGASDSVLKDPLKRDMLRDVHKIRAVEMESAGIASAALANEIGGYLTIRGICDYCDIRNKETLKNWQPYAAAVAAAFARAVIESIPA